jgi:hypothetical protein
MRRTGNRGVRLFAGGAIAFALGSGALAAPPADSIEYALTDTKLKAALELKLEQCPTTMAGPVMKPSVTIAAVPAASPIRHRIAGRDLTSFFQKREASVALYDNGTLKSVGGSASDRTAAIIAGFVKAAASLVIPLIPGTGPELTPAGPPIKCKADIEQALKDNKSLGASIDALRGQLLASRDPARIRRLTEALGALADQRSAAQAKLKLTAETDLVPPTNMAEVVVARWKSSDFNKWFENIPGDFAAGFALPVRFDPVATPAVAAADAASEGAPAKGPYLLLREPVMARLTYPAEGRGSYWTAVRADGPDAQVLPLGQWGGLSYYPLRAGFGRTRSLKLEFDSLGRKTSMTVNSEATGETIVAGATSATDSLASVYKASTETARQQIRINQLKTDQDLRKLEACQEKLDAGLTC